MARKTVKNKKKKTTSSKHKEANANRDDKGRFGPGNVANPKGRPKGSRNTINMKELLAAIAEVEAEQSSPKRKNLLKYLIYRAYESDDVLKALFKKLLPDLKSIEHVERTDPEEQLRQAEFVQERIRARFEQLEKVKKNK